MDLLSSLLCRGNQIELDNQQKREQHQAESDLFVDEESLITEESSNDKVPDHLVYRPEAHLLGNFELLCREAVLHFAEPLIKANDLKH